MWVGAAYSAVIDLVLPRMRAVAVALFLFSTTFIGLALGPFTLGKVSDYLTGTGISSAEALRSGMLYTLLIAIVVFVCLLLGARYADHDLASKLERARAAGEDV